MKRGLAVATFSAVLFAAGFVPMFASAHRIYVGWDVIYTNNRDFCLKGKVTTDHGSTGNGYFQFEGQSQGPDGYGHCNGFGILLDPGDMRIWLAAWKTNATTNCIDTGWVYNGVQTSYMKINRPKNPDSNPYDKPPCGGGHYWTKGKVAGYRNGSWDNSSWLLTNESHYLPTTPGGNGG
jgi:hypothetical protein